MPPKVKYPIRAALARFLSIRNHLANLDHYLFQAGHAEFAEQISVIRVNLVSLEEKIEPFREKQGR